MGNIVVHSFSGGEMSPKIDTRADTAKYRSGCRILENMIPLTYGCAERRPGTGYCATAKLSPSNVRMEDFVYSSDIAYEVEFGNEYARFFYDGELIVGADITTPYQVEDLPELQTFQLGDVMWIVHRNYAPRKLSRTTSTTFSLDSIVFEKGPFLTRNDIQNDDDVTMKLSADYGVGDTGTLTASSDTFEEEHVGALFELTHPRDDVTVDVSGDGNSSSAWVIVKGQATFTTHGDWWGTVTLQRSHDGGTTIDDYRVYKASSDRNVQLTWSEEEDDISYRISAAGIGHAEHDFGAEIQPHETLHRSVFRIVSRTTAKIAVVTCVVAAPAINGTDATKRWAEGAWSAVRGYPSAVGAKDGRIWYGGTNYQPSTIWCSKVEDYERFEAGVKDDDSFSRDLMTHNEIVWISTLDGLVIGTTGGIWVGRPSKLDTVIKPTDFNVKEYVTFGSAKIQAIKVDNVILYVDEARRKIREFTYGSSDAEYVSPDLTVLSEHITSGLIASMAFQKNPDPILWVCCDDGQLLSMTYERDQEVVGWAKHPFGNRQGIEGVYPTLREVDATTIPDTPDLIAEITLAAETEVSTADGLQAMSGSGNYKLTADIDLTGYGWDPIEDFEGVLEGDSHKIIGLHLDNPELPYQSLFENLVTNAQIRNVTFENCITNGTNSDYLGAEYLSPISGRSILCSVIYTQSNILLKNINFVNCKILKNDATDDDGDSYYSYHSGMLCGNIADSSVCVSGCKTLNCTIDNVTGEDALSGGAGLLIGFISTYSATGCDVDIVDCEASNGSVLADGGVGGLIGDIILKTSDNTVDVFGCETNCLCSSSYDDLGGLIGFAGCNQEYDYACNNNVIRIVSCDSKGSVVATDGSWYAGGLIGGMKVYVNDGSDTRIADGNSTLVQACTSSSPVSVTGGETASIGGLIGGLSAEEYSPSDIVIATNSALVIDCYATGSVTVNGTDADCVGGLIGGPYLDPED